MRALAEAAAAKGFATLRYDKRGLHANRASFPPADKLADFYRWENIVGDAGAAYRALAAVPEVDAARIAILGHSEGGIIALRLAAEPDTRPAALVLAAVPGRPLHVLLREQVRASLLRSGAAPISREAFLATFDETIEHIRKTGEVPADLPPAMQPLFPRYLGPFFRSLFAVDPAALATRFAGPVLMLQGESDLQVSAERDAAPLEAALRRRAGGDQTLRLFAKLSHNFKPASGPADHAVAGPLPAEVSASLTDWLAARLGKR